MAPKQWEKELLDSYAESKAELDSSLPFLTPFLSIYFSSSTKPGMEFQMEMDLPSPNPS
jgi:hypothetical protein